MPRRTHPALLAASLAAGLLLAFGVAACGSGGSSGSRLDPPPLTVGTDATLPSTTTTATTTTGTTSTTSTTDNSGSSGGGASSSSGTGGSATGGGTTGGGGTAGGTTGGGTTGGNGGGGASGGGGGGTGTATQPSNAGGASPNYQGFCNQNPGAC